MNKAAVVWDHKGLRITDTTGEVVYEMEMGPADQAGEGDRDRADRLYRERTQCVDCGTRVDYGAIYCRLDAPYGFWHWLKYFSAVRWHRRAEQAGRRGLVGEG